MHKNSSREIIFSDKRKPISNNKYLRINTYSNNLINLSKYLTNVTKN